MSEWGSVIAAVETIARATFPNLRAGDAGFERGVRPIETLQATELPHVFAHNPDERVEVIDLAQESVEFSIELLFVPTAGTTQDALTALLDAFRNAVQADPTLGGVCERAWLRSRAVLENPARELKAGSIELVAEWTS